MKLLLDQPLSWKLVVALQQSYPGTAHVSEHGLQRASDDEVWRWAKGRGIVLVTKDEDFQVLSFARGHPPKVVLLKVGNGPSAEVLGVLLKARQVIEVFVADAASSLLALG